MNLQICFCSWRSSHQIVHCWVMLLWNHINRLVKLNQLFPFGNLQKKHISGGEVITFHFCYSAGIIYVWLHNCCLCHPLLSAVTGWMRRMFILTLHTWLHTWRGQRQSSLKNNKQGIKSTLQLAHIKHLHTHGAHSNDFTRALNSSHVSRAWSSSSDCNLFQTLAAGEKKEKKETTFLLSYFGDDKLQSIRVRLWFTFYLLKRRQRGRTDPQCGSVSKPTEMEVSATQMTRRHVNEL